MPSETFTVNIEMGNEAMSDRYDVVAALEGIVSKLENGYSEGVVKDGNGNTVGRWCLDTSDQTA